MSEEQKKLVSILDTVHNKLRVRKRQAKDDEEWRKAWEEHTQDVETLQEYSTAMHQLAVKIWEPRNTRGEGEEKLKCRLEWVVRHCKEYFREIDKKLRLLDVGSCYNPFGKFGDYFDIVAVDLCPAKGLENEVFQCDFLALEVEGSEMEAKPGPSRLTHLPKNSFDVLVFSYFLEYLADPRDRVESCRKAFNLLIPGGLLFVLRPDSNRVTPGGNSILVKRMKIGMALLGFKRIFFEKLEHLWCMAFKKMEEDEKRDYLQWVYFKKDIRKAGQMHLLGREGSEGIEELFQISQDFKEFREDVEGSMSGEIGQGAEGNADLLEELPFSEV